MKHVWNMKIQIRGVRSTAKILSIVCKPRKTHQQAWVPIYQAPSTFVGDIAGE